MTPERFSELNQLIMDWEDHHETKKTETGEFMSIYDRICFSIIPIDEPLLNIPERERKIRKEAHRNLERFSDTLKVGKGELREWVWETAMHYCE